MKYNYIGLFDAFDWKATKCFVKILKFLRFLKSKSISVNILFQEKMSILGILSVFSGYHDTTMTLVALKMNDTFSKYWSNLDTINAFLFIGANLDP